MDRLLNFKLSKDVRSSIYEIYRACRLCGASAGYKMPIVQSVINVDGDELLDLKKKIGECMDIEVNLNDRMPPLICELCADKVNNFYDFRKMCQLTDKRTRLRLGLPLVSARKDSLQNNNCIHGAMEPACGYSDSEEEPLSRLRPQSAESKAGPEAKKQCRRNVRSSTSLTTPSRRSLSRGRERREARAGRRPRSDERPARRSEGSDDAAEAAQADETPMLIPRHLKRPREKDVTMETPPPPAERVNKASEISTPNGVTILKSHENAIESRKHKKTGSTVENKPANTTYKNSADRRNAPDKDTQNLCEQENSLTATNQDRTVETTEVKEGATERGSFEHKQIGLSYVCDSCQYCGVSKELLERHMRFHDDRRPFHCDTCRFRFLSKSNLIKHKIIHGINLNNIKIHECNICLYKTHNSARLKGHLLRHAGKRPYSCDMCNKRFTLAGNLKTHQRMHTGEKPYKCSACEKRFPWASELKTHQRTHTGEKPYKCRTCEKSFTTACNLKTHQRMHTGEKPYKCSTCEKRFTQASVLKKHQRTHTREKPYVFFHMSKCRTCEKIFTQASSLKRHQITHTGEKPYKCRTCEKRFTQASNLKSHQRTHTGEKPYKCRTCEKKYTQAIHLKIHERTHTGEKPYKCMTCEKRFTEAGSLKIHQRTHTGEKLYNCNICEYRSAYSSALRRHLRTHVGQNVGSE